MSEPMSPNPAPPPAPAPLPPARSGTPKWLLFVGGGCGLLLLLFAVMMAFFFYIGLRGPETDVYAGNEVPSRFVKTMRGVGALEPDERLTYFYSDAMTDIRDGFYFVSDRRVVVYIEDAGVQLTSVDFDRIADVDLDREESFFIDSQMTIELEDGSVVAFPVSSENEGDVRFYETIRKRAGLPVERP